MLDGNELARLHPAELLGRAELGEPPAEAAGWLSGRRVMITGAGGSVGAPLAAAIAEAGPAHLALIDHHEASLWTLHRRFGERRETVSLMLADIRNEQRLSAAMRDLRPDIIFHLAAYKHVPFGEIFSGEAFGVNVLGTRALVDLAAQAGVEQFVYPSSDKACNPPSLYGATKRLGEALVRRMARKTRLAYNVARFVNILGTQGSVIDTFAQQVRDGAPLTVTDAAMTRYWISMNEALWLLLTVAGQRTGEQTLMLDASNEITVLEMAHRVCLLLRGERQGCQIAFSSPRPGERLREELLSASERFEAGPGPGLLRVVDSRADQHLELLGPLLDRLLKLAQSVDSGPLREATMAAAQELQ